MGLKTAVPGMKVRLTGNFLKSTGQQKGGEGSSRWTVRPCECDLCQTGNYACTDEKHPKAYQEMMWGDLPEDQRPKYRHINLANLEQVGGKPKAEDQSDFERASAPMLKKVNEAR